MRIKTQLTILIVGFIGLLLIVSIVVYHVSYNALSQRVISDSEVVAEQINSQLHEQINSIGEDMQLFSIANGLQGEKAFVDNLPSSELLNRRFINFFETEYGFKQYEKIHLFDASGALLRTSCEECADASGSWWQQVLNDGVSYAIIDSGPMGKRISIAIALYDDTGVVWGVLQGITTINSLIRGGGLSLVKMNARKIDLISQGGLLMYSTAIHGHNDRITDQNFLEKLRTGSEFISITPSGNKELVVSSLHKHGTRGALDWNIVLYLDYDKVFGQFTKLRWWIGGSVSFIVIIASLLLTIFARRISVPLSRITSSTEEFGRGNLAERIDATYSGEFQILANAFNQMAANLEKASEILEKTVEERTLDLTESNEELTAEIEERMRSQAALSETSAILMAALDCSPAGIAIANAPDGSLRYVNDAGLGIRKGSREELVDGVSIDQYVESWNILYLDGTPYATDEIPLTRAILYGETTDRQFIIRRPNQEDRVVWAHAAPIRNEDDEIIAGIVVFPDVTEMKRMEKQLIKSSKMESIGQLAAGIAHEINTPAQFIQQNTQFIQASFEQLTILLAEYDTLMDATCSEKHLENIHTKIKGLVESMDYDFMMSEIPKAAEQSLEGLRHVSRIVQSIKQFSHTQRLEKVSADINQIVEMVITFSTNEWKYHSEIHLDLASHLPLVRCVPDLINQALLNLVVNAAYANKEKVEAAGIDKGGIYISTELDGDMLVISVRDEGNGMSQDIRDRIFDPFFTTKDIGEGTGQGLAIVQRIIVADHEGSINFESIEGEGATFVIKLPL
ncbi:MAG: ATP-binding protein [Pseudodesulfovibrio sp.]